MFIVVVLISIFILLLFLSLYLFTSKKIIKSYDIKDFNDSNKELKNLKNDITHVNAILNSDSFVSKMGIYKLLKKYYINDSVALNDITPKTWVTPFDQKSLKDYKSDTVFIAKKNIQQQQGILLFRKIQFTEKFIEKLHSEKYVVIQEYLKNPFLIDSRKTNIRVYLLIVKQNNTTVFYVYNDGFMYYTPEHYNYNTNKDSNITTGYIDRSVYEKNPLTLKDLKVYLDTNGYNSGFLFNNINDTIKKVMTGCTSLLQDIPNVCSYQLFGLDLQFDCNLNVKLIEINKSPNLKPHDSGGRDSILKLLLQKNIFDVVYNNNYENFLRLFYL